MDIFTAETFIFVSAHFYLYIRGDLQIEKFVLNFDPTFGGKRLTVETSRFYVQNHSFNKDAELYFFLFI